jgi:hypothetical protein
MAGNPLAAFNSFNLWVIAFNLSSNRSAIAMIFALVCFDIEEITAVPLLPQPMIPTLMAEFALEPKTISGFKMIAAEMATLFFINEIRFI